jgi:hypothetical protein
MNISQKDISDRKVPQFKVRTGVSAGESVEACVNNLNYWRNELYKKCGLNKPAPIV